MELPEKHVGLGRLRDKMGRAENAPDLHVSPGGPGEKIVPGGQNAQDIVHILPADGETGQAALPDGPDDLLRAVIQPEDRHVGTMDHDLLHRQVVEGEDVLDHLLFLRLDGAALFPGIHHKTDLILADILQLGLGVDAEETQCQAGQSQKELRHRAQELFQQPGQGERPSCGLFRAIPGIALRGKITQGDPQKQKCHPENGLLQVPRRTLGQKLPQMPGQPVGQRVKNRKKTESHCAHMHGGAEVIRLLNKRQQLGRLFITVLSRLFHLALAAFADGIAGERAKHGQEHK